MKNIIFTLLLLIVGQYASAQNPKIMELCHYADSLHEAEREKGNYLNFDILMRRSAWLDTGTRLIFNLILWYTHDDDAVLVNRKGKVYEMEKTPEVILDLRRRMEQVCEELSKDAVDAYRVESHHKLQDVYKRINGKAFEGCEVNPVVDDVEYAIVIKKDDNAPQELKNFPTVSKEMTSRREFLRYHHSANSTICNKDWDDERVMPLYIDSLSYYCFVDSMFCEHKDIDAKDYMNHVKPILKGIKHRKISFSWDSIITPEMEKEMNSPRHYSNNRAPYSSSTEGVIYEFESREQCQAVKKQIVDATIEYVKMHPDVGYLAIDFDMFESGCYIYHTIFDSFNIEMKNGKAPKNFNVEITTKNVNNEDKYYLLFMETSGDYCLPIQWDKASKCVNGKYTYLKGMGK